MWHSYCFFVTLICLMNISNALVCYECNGKITHGDETDQQTGHLKPIFNVSDFDGRGNYNWCMKAYDISESVQKTWQKKTILAASIPKNLKKKIRICFWIFFWIFFRFFYVVKMEKKSQDFFFWIIF